MIGRTLRMMLAVLVLGSGLMALPASGKNACSPLRNHTKGCKNEIKDCAATCIALECTGLTGKSGRHCKANCKKTCKSSVKADCGNDPTVCSASASGAFLR